MWDWLDYIHQDGLLGYITALLAVAAVFMWLIVLDKRRNDKLLRDTMARHAAEYEAKYQPVKPYEPLHIEV